MNKIIKTLIIILLLSGNNLLFAQGDDHSHDKPSSSEIQENYFSIESVSDKYELLLRYEPIDPGEKTSLTLFVSEYNTNLPVNKASIKISAQEDPKITFNITQSREGTYNVEGVFPDKKVYSLAVSINGSLGADLLLIQNLETGKKLPHQETKQSSFFSSWQMLLLLGLTLLIGIGIGFLLRKRNTPGGRLSIALILLATNIITPLSGLNAHEGEDHGAQKSGTSFAASFKVPKETQFLFEVITNKIVPGNFVESTKLFGTIMPGSNGQAFVTTPQNGEITSLMVKVGEEVKAGQKLALIEQNIDAASQVSMMAEKNNIMAEYEAAKKEFERLKSVSDIAAKRDMDEAEARLQKAESNLRLFKSNTGKTITLTAPISGVVSNFNLSVGSTVNAGQKLFTITNLSQIYAEAQVFDRDADKVTKGAKFTIECVNDVHKTSEVQLLSLAQEINATNQSQRVLFQLDNPDHDFKIGEFVNIRVFTSQNPNRISLPNSAFTEINGKPVVFIKDSAEKYSVSYVQLGENNGTNTSILKGVEEGERVVVNASYQLKMIYLNQ